MLNSHAFYFRPMIQLTGQYEIMEDELQSPAAQNAAFRLVAFHQAPYSNSSTSSTPDQIHGNRGLESIGYPCLRNMMWIP